MFKRMRKRICMFKLTRLPQEFEEKIIYTLLAESRFQKIKKIGNIHTSTFFTKVLNIMNVQI